MSSYIIDGSEVVADFHIPLENTGFDLSSIEGLQDFFTQDPSLWNQDILTLSTDVTDPGDKTALATLTVSHDPDLSPENSIMTSSVSPVSSVDTMENFDAFSSSGNPGDDDLYAPSSVSSVPSSSPEPEETSITLVISSADALRKKRGRKPKSRTEPYTPPVNRRRSNKPKVYQIDHPFENEEMERKRLNAINAKLHREKQKQEKQNLKKKLEDVTSERDNLIKEVETLRKNEMKLKKNLEAFKKFGMHALSIVKLMKTGEVPMKI